MKTIMINAIAFDLVGVLAKEINYPLSENEQILERKFGIINNNEEYFAWAMREINVSKPEIERLTKNIVDNIYELIDPEIFQHLPPIKLAIASNHLSMVHSWIDNRGIKLYFQYILISADIGIGKPDRKFFEILSQGLNEKSENILFVDDNAENIETASLCGFLTLHFHHPQNLQEEIKKLCNFPPTD
jgi:HAD superfamily hydrolase (TIGR01509 family)